MASTIWKGYLTFGLISVPVRLYAAARSERISFHMLHRECGSRIEQQLWCPVDKEVVERKDIVKGYEIEEDQHVLVEPEDLEKIEPESARTIDVVEFVKREELDPVYLDTSYYLVPDEAGEKAYYLLHKVLEELDVEGLAKLVMHQREHLVVVRPGLGGLMLHTAYYADELREVEDFGDPDGRRVKFSDKELEMGRTFIKALTTKFEPEKYHDEYREAVVKMLEEKAKGKEVTEVPKAATPRVMDLMAALKASLEGSAEKDADDEPAEKKSEAKHRGTPKRGHPAPRSKAKARK